MRAVLYIHGKGGCAAESAHYGPLFPGREVIGLDYRTCTPWETGAEIRAAVEALLERYEAVDLIANSIGAFFSLHAGISERLRQVWLISPVVDMERLICDMLGWAGVTEEELAARGTIPTAFGETLSWDYLCWVRAHPVVWTAPTWILYGGRDSLVRFETVRDFALAHGASITVMEDGEHWFHTADQLRFLDGWIKRELGKEETI